MTLQCTYFVAALLALSSLAGCDPPANVEAARAALAACLDTCKDPSMRATDQSTCRLNCAGSATTPPYPSGPPELAPLARCLGSCDLGAAARDEPAAKQCVDACRGDEIDPAAFAALMQCVTQCQASAGSRDDDQATCRLLCAQDRVAAPQ